VPFGVPRVSLDFGRKTAVHSYPLRNWPYVEDLGRKDRTFDIEAFVLGDDYVAQAARLEIALETAGPGVLVHPSRGRISVSVIQARRVEDFESEGRMARFSLTFIQGSDQPKPIVAVDTQGAVAAASAAVTSAAANDFGVHWTVVGPSWLSTVGGGDVGSALGALRSIAKGADVSGFISGAQDLLQGAVIAIATIQALSLNTIINDAIGGALSLVGLPPSLAQQVQSVIGAFQGLIGTGSLFGAFGFAGGTASGLPRALTAPNLDPNLLIADVFGATPKVAFDPLTPANAAVPATAQAAANRAALVTLIRQTALAQAAAAAATASVSDFASASQALAVRDDLAARLDAETLIAGTSAQTMAALSSLRAAVIQNLSSQAAALPSLSTFDNTGTVPALVLAARLYDDPSRGDQIAALNGVANPGFVPPGELTVMAS
jgi:prophage DNA circulation protein